jgi:hypothetical protein
MEKAYDLKDLGQRMVKLGLPVAEDTAEKMVHELFAWLEESAKVSHTTVDDLVAILYPQIKGLIMKQVDKIDGVKGA